MPMCHYTIKRISHFHPLALGSIAYRYISGKSLNTPLPIITMYCIRGVYFTDGFHGFSIIFNGTLSVSLAIRRDIVMTDECVQCAYRNVNMKSNMTLTRLESSFSQR